MIHVRLQWVAAAARLNASRNVNVVFVLSGFNQFEKNVPCENGAQSLRSLRPLPALTQFTKKPINVIERYGASDSYRCTIILCTYLILRIDFFRVPTCASGCLCCPSAFVCVRVPTIHDHGRVCVCVCKHFK